MLGLVLAGNLRLKQGCGSKGSLGYILETLSQRKFENNK
jgi:hypothetical protein